MKQTILFFGLLLVLVSSHAAADEPTRIECDAFSTIYMVDASLKRLIELNTKAGYPVVVTSTVNSNGRGNYGQTVCVVSAKTKTTTQDEVLPPKALSNLESSKQALSVALASLHFEEDTKVISLSRENPTQVIVKTISIQGQCQEQAVPIQFDYQNRPFVLEAPLPPAKNCN